MYKINIPRKKHSCLCPFFVMLITKCKGPKQSRFCLKTDIFPNILRTRAFFKFYRLLFEHFCMVTVLRFLGKCKPPLQKIL